ncbi:MAG: zeta toxin family protein [Bacteroidales bacterium]|nr:zeta toxin family protein [Bacteroidales bacterium]
MHPSEIQEIFKSVKEEFLRGISSDEHPVGILLGGQGAVGKGQLNIWAEKLYTHTRFLAINGDNYRLWHPNFNELRKDIWSFSANTQQFSSVFTEQLMEESFQRKISFVVEGTMRQPEIPMQTARLLKNNLYGSAAFVIAAPQEFSLLNVFIRYCREVQNKGFGRMVDLQSHNAAVSGLLKTVDMLYQERSVERICIFDCFARNLIADYNNEHGVWDNDTLPSILIQKSREEQLANKKQVEELLLAGETTLSLLTDAAVRDMAQAAYDNLRQTMY